MKTWKLLSALFIAVLVSMTAVSCGDDDEENGNNEAKVPAQLKGQWTMSTDDFETFKSMMTAIQEQEAAEDDEDFESKVMLKLVTGADDLLLEFTDNNYYAIMHFDNDYLTHEMQLFTDAEYRSIDFKELENYLQWRYPYYDTVSTSGPTAFGNTYYIGQDKDSSIKLDLMYTDAPFFEKHNINKGIRMATINQITAMKIEAINTGGRKKDWWVIHELLTIYNLDEMLSLHKRWEQWTHNREQLLDKLIIFNNSVA